MLAKSRVVARLYNYRLGMSVTGSRQKAITKVPCKSIKVWVGDRFGNAKERKFSANR